ncbi:MAG: zinc transporter ZupT [Candidatus Margulisiibacteriota bacterium]
MQNPIFIGLVLSLFAGLATTIGALIALLVKKTDFKILALALGFSAGVMFYISFVELLGQSINHIGMLSANIAFFLGILLIYLIDVLIPHEYIAECIPHAKEAHLKPLIKTGVMTTIGISIHNLAEGAAVFVGTIHSIGIGIFLAIAIAIHNIPEGISVSLPIYCATGSRKKAFWFSFFSGITEPIGALLAVLFLWPFLTPFFVNWLLAFVGGIMVYISFDELLPAANKYGEEHVVGLGIILGMLVMAASIVMLR